MSQPTANGYRTTAEVEALVPVLRYAEEYARILTAAYHPGYPTTEQERTFRFEYNPRAKYHRITRAGSVHAFIDANGNVYKPAGWKAPAKHVRYSLTDPASRQALYAAAAAPDSFAGGYLYLSR